MRLPAIDRYNFKDEVKYIYFQLPKLLVYGKYYIDILTNDDLVAYQLLYDRMKVSKKNNWLDDEGNYYLVYTNSELMKILKCGKEKLSKIKKRLSSVNLIDEEKTGRASKIYLSKPQAFDDEEARYILEINDQDMGDKTKFTDEEKQKLSDSKKGNENAQKTIEVRKSNFSSETPSNQHSSENEKQQKFDNRTTEVRKSNTSNNNLVRTKELKDLKDVKDRETNEQNLFKNSLKNATENSELENELIDFMIEQESLNQIFGYKLIDLMKSLSFNSYATFERYINKLKAGSHEAEKAVGQSIPFFYDQHFKEIELPKTFLQVIKKEKNGEIKSSFEGYLFMSFKQKFIEYSKFLSEKNLMENSEYAKVSVTNLDYLKNPGRESGDI